ncbi:MAG: GGDEF domain-containing protein [Ilumatobacteraceae bacterium]
MRDRCTRWADHTLRGVLPVNPVFALTSLWFFRDHLDQRPWAAWLALLLLGTAVAAIGLTARSARWPVHPRTPDIVIAGSLGVLGLGWGLLPWLVATSEGGMELGLLSVPFVIGAASVNAISNAGQRLRFHVYQTTLLSPVLLWASRQSDPMVRQLVGIGLGFAVLNVAVQRGNRTMAISFISAELENQAFVEAEQRQRRQLEVANERLEYQTRHDELTDLFNRRGFVEALGELMSQHASVFVAVADLDRFKT